MKKDIAHLQNLNKETKERCIINESDRSQMNSDSQYRPWSPDVIAYEIKYVTSKVILH